MKKQFFRVKQLADQTFSRAGKTEVLSDDLQEADKRVEFIRNACQNTTKKLSATLLGQGVDGTAKEKRLKKSPDYLLGHAMLDSSACDENYLLSYILAHCGKVETALAGEVVDHDLRIEQEVLNPILQILETEVPNILKHKRNLAKLILDMDSARTRHQTALKHSGGGAAGGSGNNAKVDSIKEELEDAEQKVEQCRDMLATEMFTLISKEAHLSNLVVEYAKLQRAYHENALNILGSIIPDLENYIKDSATKPVYGQPLEEHLRVTKRKIAFPIELCVCALLELGMEEEGLFRVAGGASKVRRMKMSFDACCLSLQTTLEYHDPHVIAGALKSYLRELPEPLFTHDLYDDWMAAARVQGTSEERLQALWQVLHRLPPENFENVKYLIKFLSILSRNQDVNKMSPQNIAIVIAPNLIWSQADDSCGVMGMNMNTANLHSFIVDNLVSYADWFFPGDLEFYQTISKPDGVPSTNGNELFGRGGATVNGMTTSLTLVEGNHRKGHTRSSSGSGDVLHTSSISEPGLKRTQSGSSLSDHGSPTHGSPKPVIRRKNKPAPVPPVEKPEKPPRPSPIVCIPNDSAVKKVSEVAPLARSEEDEEDDDDGGFKGCSVPLTQAIRVPIAAPRTVIPAKGSQEELADVSSVEVVERHKPAVPERPPSLRPSHAVAHSATSTPSHAPVLSNNAPTATTTPTPTAPTIVLSHGEAADTQEVSNSESAVRPMLERTTMYSVDKQQVSIIQVGGEKSTSGSVHSVSDLEPPHGRLPSTGGGGTVRSVSNPTVMDKKDPVPERLLKADPVPAEKPERPPKPENLSHMSTLERRRHSNSSHSRTTSDCTVAEKENTSRIEAEKPVVSGKPPLPALQPGSSVFTYPSSPAPTANSGPHHPPSHQPAAVHTVTSPSLPPNSPRAVAHPHRPPRPTPPPPPIPTTTTTTFTNSSCQTLPVKPRAASVSESTDL